MTGAVAKTYYAEKMGIDPKNVVMVSVMPCIAKKYEAALPSEMTYGIRDVDIVLTTRELAKMLKEGSVDLRHIQEEEFDNPLGFSTGAGIILADLAVCLRQLCVQCMKKLPDTSLKMSISLRPRHCWNP
jgi:NADH-quinone oxidoreductase subunit G